MNQKATFTLLAGIAGSGKTTALLSLYRDALRQAQHEGRPGRALWLSPTNRAQSEIQKRLLDGSLEVVFRPNLLTFDQFADEVLKGAPGAIAPCSSAMQRVLVRRIVGDFVSKKQLRHFPAIALTSGFLDLVMALISELKRGETWPEDFVKVCRRRGNRAIDHDLGLIYERYQQLLQSANVYDGEGRFWSARAALEAGQWGRFSDLSFAVVDGFTDFTQAQYKILELLARHTGRVHISLLAENPLVRNDLFAKTNAVVSRLEQLGRVEIRTCPLQVPREAPGGATSAYGAPEGIAAGPAAICHIAANLFVNPRESTPSSSATGIEVVEIAGQVREIRYLAARVKDLLHEGTAPDDVVVAVRDLDGSSDLIDEIFSAAGIPFASEAGTTAMRLPPARALVNVLSLEIEDWPFGRLMSLLDSRFFQPEWEEFANRQAARDVSAELRRHQLADDRERILTVLQRIADQPGSEGAPPQAARAHRAWQLLRRLSQATDKLRRKHDLEGWSGVIAGLVREFGFDRAPLGAESDESDRTFGTFLTSLLYDASKSEHAAGLMPQQLTLSEFLVEFTDLLGHKRLPPRRSEQGRVRILSAEQVRNLDVPCLFLAGLIESSFPRHRGDDCLYSERDRQELNELGLSLGYRTLRAQEELLMFYGIVTRARRMLVLTRPISSDEGQPLSPSPYLSSVCELFDSDALQVRRHDQLDPILGAGRLLSPADLRVKGMADALAGQPGLFRAACETDPAARHSLAAVEMNVLRFQTPGFSNYEGRLENPRNIELLWTRFSPADHEFSATQLEAYAACPFRFLISHVLQLEPPTPPEIETDYARRGTRVHELLAELHRTLSVAGIQAGRPQASPTGADVATAFQRLLEAKIKDRPAGGPVHQALDRIERRLLAEWGQAYGEQWKKFVDALPDDLAQPLRPALFEIAFGKSKPVAESGDVPGQARSSFSVDEAADDPQRSPAVATPKTFPPLVLGEGDSTVKIGGRIDRIDTGRNESGPVFTVIDYKTGSGSLNAGTDTVESGRKVQLALYALAVLRLGIAGPEARPWQMGYWYIREAGFASALKKNRQQKMLPIEAADWSELVATLEAIILQGAAGIRAGRFPVENADTDCTSHCPYNTVCRVAQIRPLPESLKKQSHDPEQQ